MSSPCQVTGVVPSFGKTVSHSPRRGIESVVAEIRARGEKI